MNQKSQQAGPQETPQIKEEAKPRVLICDDSRIVRATIIKNIKSAFDVKEATDGEAGWAALNADDTIEVLISDLSMPKLDGFGLLARLRGCDIPRLRELPVIIISGEDESDAHERAAVAGATDFITKGTGAIELQSRLEALVKLNRANRQLEKSRDTIAQTSTTDPLTGLGTPHFLMLRGAQIFSHARRQVNNVAVVHVMLDGQDGVNKRFGKQVADQLLVFFGKLLSSRMRKEDCIARMSDTEFTLVCPSTALSNANLFANRLREAVAAAKVNFRDEIIAFTASVGVANTDQDVAQSIEELYELAKTRMQTAQRRGGNTMVSSEELKTRVPAQAPSVDEALGLLAAGDAERLSPHLVPLLRRLLPLLKLLNTSLGLKLPVEALEQATKPKT
jgi:two-component system cell cycle response regulator